MLEPLQNLTMHPTSPSFWRDAVDLQAERMVECLEGVFPDAFDEKFHGWWQLGGRAFLEAQFLCVAMRNSTRFQDKILAMTGSPELREACATLRSEFPNLRHLRDIVEHVDEYATGSGNLQRSGVMAHDPDGRFPLMYVGGQDVTLSFGSIKTPLLAAAREVNSVSVKAEYAASEFLHEQRKPEQAD